LVLASLIVGLEMRLMRDEPQGRVIEPVSEIGTAHVRDFRQFSDTRATCEQPEIEASQFHELFAVVVRVHIAKGSQDGRRGGLADPGQRHQEVVVRAMGKQLDGLVEPQLLFGQGLDQVVCQWGELERVEAIGGTETDAGCGQVLEAVEGLRAPLPAALAGLPLFQKAGAAVAQERLWSWIGLQEAQSGRLRQVLHQGIEFRKCQVEGRSQLIAELADPFFQRHSPLHQPISGLQFRVAFDGQKKLPLPQQVEDTIGICFISFTGALLHGLAIVPHGLAVDQANPIATPLESVVEGLPVDTRGLHSDEDVPTGLLDELLLEGLFKTLDPLAGVRKFKFAAAHAYLGTKTGIVFGFAHIHAHHE
jgi:hypothetical protein